jgi:hypothetical protein
MATRISMLKCRNIDMTRAGLSGQEEQELRVRAREPGRELKIGKEETVVTIESQQSF